MSIAEDDDLSGDGWDEATADPQTRIRPSATAGALRSLWDDPTTEDEGGKCTRIVDAGKVLSELGHLAAEITEDESSGRTRIVDAGQVLRDLRSLVSESDEDEGSSSTRIVDSGKVLRDLGHLAAPGGGERERISEPPSGMRPSPRPRSSASETTPVVGQTFMFSQAAADALAEEGSLLEIDEAPLSADERAAIEAQDVEELDAHAAEMLDQDALPRLMLSPRELASLSLDHRAGFLLSLIDGVSSVHDILDMCGMPQAEALEILFRLAQRKVIDIER